MMNKTFQIAEPSTPDTYVILLPPGSKNDGLNFDRGTFSITELSEKEAEEFGEMMKQSFIEKWKRLTKNNNTFSNNFIDKL